MQKLQQKMLTLAEQCVKCGMCLPSCPTNKLTNLEGHSPRGRIALWQSIAKQQLTPTEQTLNYLNQCLSCGACENNCPAGVKFLELQDTGKSYLLNNNFTQKYLINTRFNNFIITILCSKYLNKLAALGLYFYQRLNLKLISRLNSLTKVAFPTLSFKAKTFYKSTIGTQQNVLLFTGCANNIAAQNTIRSIINVLNKLEVNVIVEHSLTCCAALYSHSGEADAANNIIQKNKKTLSSLLKKQKIDHVLTIDTGCHQQIAKQFLPLSQNAHQQDFVLNIQVYLLRLLNSTRALPTTTNNFSPDVYIYNPCSQREQLKSADITQQLLKICLPSSTLKTVSKGFSCCGAAGRYMLDHPQIAEKLALEVLKDMVKTPALLENAIICTTNIGCALHLQNILLKNYGIKAAIKHPIALICENLA